MCPLINLIFKLEFLAKFWGIKNWFEKSKFGGFFQGNKKDLAFFKLFTYYKKISRLGTANFLFNAKIH